jgi:hypothetical protein
MRWLVLLWPCLAHGKATSDVGYGLPEVYSAAVRYVRVDRGCKLIEKDADVAFVAFECKNDLGKASRGTVEMFKSNVQKHERVKLAVTLPDEPHYIELRFLELLERKLRDDLGSPAPPPTDKPAADKADLGT